MSCTERVCSLGLIGKRCENRKASVPWKEIATNPQKFIRAKYLPDNAVLGDPSHITLKQGRRLYKWWHGRQSDDQRALRFENCAPRHVPKRLRHKSPTAARPQRLHRRRSDDDGEAGPRRVKPRRSGRLAGQSEARRTPLDEDVEDEAEGGEREPSPPMKIGPPRGVRQQDRPSGSTSGRTNAKPATHHAENEPPNPRTTRPAPPPKPSQPTNPSARVGDRRQPHAGPPATKKAQKIVPPSPSPSVSGMDEQPTGGNVSESSEESYQVPPKRRMRLSPLDDDEDGDDGACQAL